MRPATFFVACLLTLGLVSFGSYSLGTIRANQRHALALATIDADRALERDAADRSMGELRQSLVESENRIDGIGRGLSEAVAIAGRATDRSIRVKILIDGIDAALAGIRGGPHD